MVGYKFTNYNPYGDTEENDCVNRAIANVSGLGYNEIKDKLFYVGKLLDCESKCVCCYGFLLNNVFGYEPIKCRGLTLYEFAEEHPYGLYLCRSEGHISVLDNYVVEDIFDCRDMILTNAWRIA
jgi:hypothetical protein